MDEIPERTFMERNVVLAPIHMKRLLEIYCSPAKQNCPHLMSSTGSCRPIDELMRWGLIERESIRYIETDEHGWNVTEKGRVYVEALLRLPLPVQSWSVPNRPGC